MELNRMVIKVKLNANNTVNYQRIEHHLCFISISLTPLEAWPLVTYWTYNRWTVCGTDHKTHPSTPPFGVAVTGLFL